MIKLTPLAFHGISFLALKTIPELPLMNNLKITFHLSSLIYSNRTFHKVRHGSSVVVNVFNRWGKLPLTRTSE